MMQPLPKFLACSFLFLFPTLVWGQHRIFPAHSERRSAPVTLAWDVRLEKDKNEWTTSEERAKTSVLEKAQRRLGEWLREKCPGCSFLPKVEFIERYVAKEGVKVQPEDDVDVDGEKVKRYSASVKLQLDADAQRKLLSEVDKQMDALRSEVTWSREWLLLKGLLFLIALAGAGAGYFHFDDRTQGYYTKPLRIVAVAAVVLAGYGITMLP